MLKIDRNSRLVRNNPLDQEKLCKNEDFVIRFATVRYY